MSKSICDRCNKYEISPCYTVETCHAYHERTFKFTHEITKEYIEQRLTGEKTSCKEYEPIKIIKL